MSLFATQAEQKILEAIRRGELDNLARPPSLRIPSWPPQQLQQQALPAERFTGKSPNFMTKLNRER
jgi:hypothetical protein